MRDLKNLKAAKLTGIYSENNNQILPVNLTEKSAKLTGIYETETKSKYSKKERKLFKRGRVGAVIYVKPRMSRLRTKSASPPTHATRENAAVNRRTKKHKNVRKFSRSKSPLINNNRLTRSVLSSTEQRQSLTTSENEYFHSNTLIPIRPGIMVHSVRNTHTHAQLKNK